MSERLAALSRLAPGVLACAVVALAAAFLGQHYGAPTLLFALLLGLAMSFLSLQGPCAPGIEFCSKHLLRAGVALLGLQFTLGQVAQLGWPVVAMVVGCVALTIGVSVLAARALGFQGQFGLLTGGATAICGASAALALSAALPPHPLKERATLFTVIGVSVLSSLCMVAYPMLARAFDLPAQGSGIFIGATIHDVAQVVGAGYSISTPAGDVATLVKLLRVALLLPVILLATTIARTQATAGQARTPLLPGFVLAFAALLLINSSGVLPAVVPQAGQTLSRGLLVLAIAGIGMKTQLAELAQVGIKPVLLMLGETVFLAALVLAWLLWR